MSFEVYPGVLIDDKEYSFSTNLPFRFFKFTKFTGPLSISLCNGSRLQKLSNPKDITISHVTQTATEASLTLDLDDVYTQLIVTDSSSPANSQIITVQRSDDIATVPAAPTGFSVEATESGARLVIIKNSSVRDSYVSYNFYASKESGGILTGYLKVNPYPVTNPKTYEEQVPFYSGSFSDQFKDSSGVLPRLLQVSFTGNYLDNDSKTYLPTTDLTQDSFLLPPTAKTLQADVSFSTTVYTQEYSYSHDRSVDFQTVTSTSPLYYVATTIQYDTVKRVELESAHSIELPSAPVVLSSQLNTLPQPTRDEILQDIAGKILSARPDISIQPGSVIRDLTLDPFSFEFERVRFLLDFFYRTTSFSSLLAIDGNATYLEGLRQALYLPNTEKAQVVINNAFDKLVSNFFQYRQEGVRARGQVVFYTLSTPSSSIYVPPGTIVVSGQLQFRTLEGATLDINRLSSYRDPITNRYVLRVLAEAINPGVEGNVGPGQIRQILSLIRGVSVTNETAFFGGTPEETNRQLYERCSRILASVDSGTTMGYRQLISGTAGVLDSYLAGPGHRFMFRDYSELLGKNLAGKVDLWVQGYNPSTVQESFSVDALISYNQPFEIFDRETLKFRLKDVNIITDLVKLLNVVDLNGSHVLGFKRGDTYKYFDLVDPADPNNTFKISETGILTLPSTPNNSNIVTTLSFATPLLGDIQLKSPKKYTFKKYQPVTGIESVVVDTASGVTTLSNYKLYTNTSPFMLGNSSKSEDYIVIDSSDTLLDAVLQVSYEPVTFTNTRVSEYFSKYGIFYDTVKVFSSTDPEVLVATDQYFITRGSETDLTGIKISDGSDLKSGDTVYVSYSYRPNITVNYTTNLLISASQEAVDSKKHMAADVIVKGAYPVPVNIGATVIVKKGIPQPSVATDIRTNITNYFEGLRLGDPVRQSDIVDVIESTAGVSYVELPLIQLSRANRSAVMFEPLYFQGTKFYPNDSSLDGADYLVYLSDNLYHNSMNSSEMTTYYHSVLMDRKELKIITETVSNPVATDASYLDVPAFTGPYQAAILNSENFDSRVFITLPKVDENPLKHEFYTCYIASGDRGPKNIEPEDIEYTVLGELYLQFGEDSR